MVRFRIVSGWELTHVANHNPVFFSVFPCTEKLIKFFYLNVSAPDNFSVQIILTCSTYLKITFILISEQPKTSWFLVILSKWFNRTKVSNNQTLIGCLPVKLGSRFEIKSSKPHFYLVFFEKTLNTTGTRQTNKTW